MLDSFPISVLVGIVLGFLAGLGVGGGSLLILWLTCVLGMEPQTARSINLLFFLPCAAISICFRRKQGHLPLKKIIPAMVTGCLAAVAFSWLGSHIHTELLRKLFGGLLILTGLRELFYKRRQ